jgi:hypothetical protein
MLRDNELKTSEQVEAFTSEAAELRAYRSDGYEQPQSLQSE